MNCNFESMYAPLFGCVPEAHKGDPSCSTGVYTNLSLVVTEQDYMKDSLTNMNRHGGPARDYKWQICKNKTILHSTSMVNGDLKSCQLNVFSIYDRAPAYNHVLYRHPTRLMAL